MPYRSCVRINIKRSLFLLRQQTRPECTVARRVRRQLTIAEMAGMCPAKVRDSRGAQWTYFPSIISGSNVPGGGWPFTLGKQAALSPAYNVVVYVQLVIIHTAIHFVSTLCSTNIVLLLYLSQCECKMLFWKACSYCPLWNTNVFIVDNSSDTLSATHNISCSKPGSVTVRDFSGGT